MRGQILGLAILALVLRSDAFIPPKSTRRVTRRERTWSTLSAELLTKEQPKSTTESILEEDALSQLEFCKSRTAASRVLGRSCRDGLYKSVSIPKGMSAKTMSDAELRLQTRTINSRFTVMELIEQNGDRDIDRASLAVLSTFLFGSSSAILVQQSTGLPDIIRWLVVFALCFSPLVLVGFGLAVPSELSAALVSIQREIFPTYRRRMIQHEAGHFLLGHLLGWPVQSYRANNAVKSAVEFYPLSDEDVGRDRAASMGFDAAKGNSLEPEIEIPDKPFYSNEGQGGAELKNSVFRDEQDITEFELEPADDPKKSWPFRGFDEETLDILAVISVAGAASELLAFGNAEGGVADLLQLRRFYGAAAAAESGDKSGSSDTGSVFGEFGDDAKERRLRRQGEKTGGGMGEREMDNRTKFAIGYAMVLLRQHLGVLDDLAEVMERGGSVSECIIAIETCPNVSGYTLEGDYEKMRREKFRKDGLGGFIEQAFLGGKKTIDAEEESAIYGKGGGGRKQKFQLTGDDPFYAAGALAFAFFVWASNGGLSLH